MKFIDTILTLLAVVSTAISAYFVGHALSTEHPEWAWATAGALLLLGLALGWFAARRIRRYPPRSSDEPLH